MRGRRLRDVPGDTVASVIHDGRGAGTARAALPDEIPPGWEYNASTWRERLPIVGTALVGALVAGYLALYQWRLLPDVWEPFFGDGSRVILDSPVSHILPIPDAALGAMGYVLDVLTGLIGGRRRWRTMPWMVIGFGIAVGPLGAVSILLVILQPVLFDAWCTLCLASAVLSIVMIGPSMDEVLASLQALKRAHVQGRSAWRALWGLDGPAAPAEPAAVPLGRRPGRPPARGGQWMRWTQVAGMLLGVWLMAAPDILGYGGPAATSGYVVGPLVASVACMALWPVLWPLRRVNLALGAWLAGAPWLLAYEPVAAANSSAVGLLLMALSGIPRSPRPVDLRLGGGWAALLPGRR